MLAVERLCERMSDNFTFKKCSSKLNQNKNGQSWMHVTMLRLTFAYAIFTAPLVPAHFVDNTSDNNLWMTPFKVGFVNTIFDTIHHSESHIYVMFFFSVNDALLMVLLDVRNQRHHLRCLFK